MGVYVETERLSGYSLGYQIHKVRKATYGRNEDMNNAVLRQCNTPPTTTITYCVTAASLKSAYAAPAVAKILCFFDCASSILYVV
jgi:hypothetical protein